MKFLSIFILVTMFACNEKPTKGDIPGVDKDSDGIRDDVQEFIEKSSYPDDLKKAQKQYARTMQKVLLESSDKERSIENARLLIRASLCTTYIERQLQTDEYTYQKIRSEILDTSERLDAWNQVNDHFNGQISDVEIASAHHCDP
jgi:hypothetical protein